MTQPVISVIICTHNRADLARDAILSVLEQDFPRDEYELLIVDNASTDNTRAMAQEICKAHPNVRFIFESNVGLSYARNRGWTEASGEYVGYLDDDAKASAQWLFAAYTVVNHIHPEAFGGPYYAFYNTPKPRWFKDEYGSHVQGEVARSLKSNEYLDGGNMFIRRDLLALHGGFQIDMGMKGSKIAYGEETHFFKQARGADPKFVLFYDPAIMIYHLVRKDKMNLWAVPKRFFSSGMYSTRIDGAHKQIRSKVFLHILQSGLQFLFSFFRGFITRNKSKYPYIENYLYEVAFVWFFELGSLVEVLLISSAEAE